MSKMAKHAFGSEANVDSAISSGKIDAYDIMFLNEGKISWLDRNGRKITVDGKRDVVKVEQLPEDGMSQDVVYICNGDCYIWDGSRYISLLNKQEIADINRQLSTKIDAETVDEKIASSMSIIEF